MNVYAFPTGTADCKIIVVVPPIRCRGENLRLIPEDGAGERDAREETSIHAPDVGPGRHEALVHPQCGPRVEKDVDVDSLRNANTTTLPCNAWIKRATDFNEVT